LSRSHIRKGREVIVKVKLFEFAGVFTILDVPDQVLERSISPWLVDYLATGPP